MLFLCVLRNTCSLRELLPPVGNRGYFMMLSHSIPELKEEEERTGKSRFYGRPNVCPSEFYTIVKVLL